MITIHSVRDKQGERFPATPRKESPFSAMVRAVKFELGFGGRVTVKEPTRIVIVTSVMCDVDTTSFEGPEAEMAVVHQGIQLYSNYHNDNANLASIMRMEPNAGMDQFMGAALGMMVGGGTSRDVIMNVANIPNCDREQFQFLDDDSLAEACEMVHEGLSVHEVLQGYEYQIMMRREELRKKLERQKKQKAEEKAQAKLTKHSRSNEKLRGRL